MLELNLIGVPEVIVDGQVVTFARRGSIGLLAYLALSRRAHAREVLATLLAGDNSDEQARKYLSNVLVDLRQHIGEYLIATRQTVAFDRALPHRLDVAEFQTRATGDVAGTPPSDLDAALGLYRGEFLAGLSLAGAPDFDAWLFAEREELRGQYMQALRLQVETSLQNCAWSSGIQSARRLIAEEPWLEEAHRQLMLMLAHSGQRHAAIAQFQTCRRVLRDELAVEPQPETTALFNRLRAAITPPPHNLPVPGSQFVGRAQQLQRLTTLLADPECHLTTIVGLGGSGKTRLALEVARGFATPATVPPEQPFPDGIIFVSLAERASSQPGLEPRASDAAHEIMAAIDAAVGHESGEPVATRLRARAMLLVLDNFEHLQAGAHVLSELIATSPHLTLLVTSRVPLHLTDERVLYVDGLELPTDPTELDRADASALFLQEAHRADVDFELPEAERPYVVKLCRALAGFPLALVLAARWAAVLPCSAMVDELARGLDLLATTEADLPERHRSVTAILDATLARLPTEERALAHSLAMASCAPEAQSGIMHGRVPSDVLPRVRLLREQALVWVDSARGTLQLHPLLRSYVRTQHTRQPAPMWAA